jgi:Collagen triple helix repeat (20 copies)
MSRRPKWTHVTIALAAVLALGVMVTPAMGGPSLKKLVKKEVSKQIAKAIGPAGANGANGANGTNGTDGVDGANGTNGTNGTDGVDGADGTARAYAHVRSHQNMPCDATFCTIDHAKGVTSAQRLGVGAYCILVPGIDPDVVPAAVTVDTYQTVAPAGNARAMIGVDACGANTFKVFTERQPVTSISGTPVSGPAVAADDVSFTIVIP